MTAIKPVQTPIKTLRLVLGDQLNPIHSWFASPQPDVLLVMMEVRQETDYVLHHAQKIIAIFAAMRELARQLTAAGHQLHYFAIDDSENRHDIVANLNFLCERHGIQNMEYQAPDEWRLDQQLQNYSQQCPLSCKMVDSEHFYTQRDEVGQLFAGRKKWLMENFYRQMRSSHAVLMEADGTPQGGAWNYDQDNRKSWPGLPQEPQDTRPHHDHSLLWQQIQAAGVNSFGSDQAANFRWPLHRGEALLQLDTFITQVLPYFGLYQDAMSSKAWRLFHSLLSFALNVKMLNPREVVQRAAAAYADGSAPLQAVEGFIRQILGWREYIRGVYWHHMPDYVQNNFFGHQRDLPAWFWTGKTKMRCLGHAIDQSLEHAHAHHIQRLMVIGNFSLLAGLNPAQVHQWYLGVYIDAFEWVELPNTLGMSQYADGGVLATKPYVSSAAYIDRMSDYCKGCHYDKKQRIGPTACPFNALYWNFFLKNETLLAKNPRIGMVYPQLRKMEPQAIADLTRQAQGMLDNLDAL